jgi:hypothetical protein
MNQSPEFDCTMNDLGFSVDARRWQEQGNRSENEGGQWALTHKSRFTDDVCSKATCGTRPSVGSIWEGSRERWFSSSIFNVVNLGRQCLVEEFAVQSARRLNLRPPSLANPDQRASPSEEIDDRMACILPPSCRSEAQIMKNLTEMEGRSDLRVRIAEMRRQISDTNHRYQSAKGGSRGQLRQLVRLKSELTRQLLDVQKELLQTYRLELFAEAPEDSQPTSEWAGGSAHARLSPSTPWSISKLWLATSGNILLSLTNGA